MLKNKKKNQLNSKVFVIRQTIKRLQLMKKKIRELLVLETLVDKKSKQIHDLFAKTCDYGSTLDEFDEIYKPGCTCLEASGDLYKEHLEMIGEEIDKSKKELKICLEELLEK